MPLITNADFETKNQDLMKRPLFIVRIEGLPEPLTTFRFEDVQVTWGGYGVGGYGTSGYGN